MFLARVTGSVVATQKVAAMTGHKLLRFKPQNLVTGLPVRHLEAVT